VICHGSTMVDSRQGECNIHSGVIMLAYQKGSYLGLARLALKIQGPIFPIGCEITKFKSECLTVIID
jgi:hypothetical protein